MNTSNIINVDENNMIVCPICNESHMVFNLFFHMYNNHPAFLAIWTAVNNPAAEDNQILNMFGINNLNDDAEEEDNEGTYEYYSELCNRIGNHIVSTDPDTVSRYEDSTNLKDNCTICLESMENKLVRSLNICSHMYCSECIEQWLSQNKHCPICKKDSTTTLPLPNPYSSIEDLD